MIVPHLPFSAVRALRPAAFLLLAAMLAGPATAQLTRVPNTTLFAAGALPASAPTTGYALADAFPGITFDYPLKAVTPPGETNRIFVIEKAGKIKVITNLASPASSVFLDLTTRASFPVYGPPPGNECGLLGLAFHPNYATNGYFYIFYSTRDASNNLFQRVSRFTVSASPNVANAASEQILLSQADDFTNHNGGDLCFGSDGYLYVSLGDEGDANDTGANSQRINKDFFSGMIRLDVDRRAANLEPNTHPAVVINGVTGTANYKVPADNPWVGATSFNGSAVSPTSVRTEWYAVGLRNPYRFSIDPPTGRIYVGDVGQGAREEIDLIVKGGNYGWNYREGLIARPGSGTPPAAAVFIDPILDYPRSDGFSVTGGLVYRGSNLPALYGQYVFADYGGNIWRVPLNEATGAGTTTPATKVLIGNKSSLVAFGTDPRNNDVLICYLATAGAADPGRLLRLVASGAPTTTFPATLAATGAFSNLATLTPNAGVVAYEPNVPFWSDFAEKLRWFSIPNTANTMAFSEDGNWTFPAGTVWVKHFDLDLNRSGTGASNKRRVETRFIVRTSDGIYGITYKWRADQTNADLVPDAGDTQNFTVTESGGATRTQTWIYPSRTNCLNCHTTAAGFALSFNTPQLNRANVFGSQTQNQIVALHGAGYLTSPGSPSAAGYARYVRADDATTTLEWRVRSYLAVNCVSCHQPGGPAQGNWDARTLLSTGQTGIIDGALVNPLGDAANRVIVRGNTAHSMIHRRVSAAINSGIHMPPLATNEINQEAVNLLAAWINGPATSYQTFPEWQLARFGSTTAPAAQDMADPDGDGTENFFEYLLGTNPLLASERWSYNVEPRPGNQISVVFPRLANRGYRVLSSFDLQSWTPWDVPANVLAFPTTGSLGEIVGPKDPGGRQFFQVEVRAP